MIRSKKELQEYIERDNAVLTVAGLKWKLIECYAAYPMYYLRKYLKYLRLQEFYINTAGKNKLKGLIALHFERKKNRLGIRLGIEIGPNSFGKGLCIWHAGNIVINPNARIGENCVLHGANCVGNNGKTEGTPRIGNNVDIGYGAVVIGDIEIADNVTIGANAVVNRSVLEPGCTIAGIPAKRI